MRAPLLSTGASDSEARESLSCCAVTLVPLILLMYEIDSAYIACTAKNVTQHIRVHAAQDMGGRLHST